MKLFIHSACYLEIGKSILEASEKSVEWMNGVLILAAKVRDAAGGRVIRVNESRKLCFFFGLGVASISNAVCFQLNVESEKNFLSKVSCWQRNWLFLPIPCQRCPIANVQLIKDELSYILDI